MDPLVTICGDQIRDYRPKLEAKVARQQQRNGAETPPEQNRAEKTEAETVGLIEVTTKGVGRMGCVRPRCRQAVSSQPPRRLVLPDEVATWARGAAAPAGAEVGIMR